MNATLGASLLVLGCTFFSGGTSRFQWSRVRHDLSVLTGTSYLATLTKNKANQYEVDFPDLAPNVATYGNNLSETIAMAKDALEGYLLVAEDCQEELPKTSDIDAIKLKPAQLLLSVEVDTNLVRDREENKKDKLGV
ncbi:type II toxin-antitoxin system HicB family antitoxin [Agrilactobacillus yilanensis]|uniref:Type II toxin-antitoxin system HicB family antitoxin n=1 Tax=Agrilactobacillus yilanensis TaxID=2485997 RepID=A0ABW4J6V3_9LACO|nr:type II toxin-antitoxin system HicB family antitoxin [Agrilactobacillus yilanensis]